MTYKAKCNRDGSYADHNSWSPTVLWKWPGNDWNDCENNRIVMNMKKSHYLVVDRSSSVPESEEFELWYNNQTLLRKSEAMLLGFILVDTVTWSDHIKYINSKIRKNINLLIFCPYIPFEYVQIFYFQFIFFHLI